jgi:hypothetical protein
MRDVAFCYELVERAPLWRRVARGVFLGVGWIVLRLLLFVSKPVCMVAFLAAIGSICAGAFFASNHDYASTARCVMLLLISCTVFMGVNHLTAPYRRW